MRARRRVDFWATLDHTLKLPLEASFQIRIPSLLAPFPACNSKEKNQACSFNFLLHFPHQTCTILHQNLTTLSLLLEDHLKLQKGGAFHGFLGQGEDRKFCSCTPSEVGNDLTFKTWFMEVLVPLYTHACSWVACLW